MLGDISALEKIYIVCGYTDMRKSIDGLCAIIEDQLKMDPTSSALFLFCGRRRDRIKALFREPDGFVLIYKRLSFLPEEERKALNYCGTVSGRDVEDKWAAAGLHPYPVDGTTGVEEAEMIFVCKKLYHQEMKPECFDAPENDERWYPEKDYHIMYMAEIEKVLVK